MSCFNSESIRCQKQHRKWLQIRVRHLRAIQMFHCQYPIHLYVRLFLPVESTEGTVTVPDYQKEGKPNTLQVKNMPSTDRTQKLEKQLQKEKSLILRNFTESLLHGLVKSRMPSVLTISSPQHPKEEKPILADFENLDFKIAGGLRAAFDSKWKSRKAKYYQQSLTH